MRTASDSFVFFSLFTKRSKRHDANHDKQEKRHHGCNLLRNDDCKSRNTRRGSSGQSNSKTSEAPRDPSMDSFLMPAEIVRTTNAHDRIVKSVSFARKSKNLIINIPRATQEEKGRLWYRIEELDRMQQKDDMVCLQATSTQGCRVFLENIFLDRRESTRHQAKLKCWCRYANNLRGLELVVNKRLSIERFVQKSVHLQSILVAQAVGREQMAEIAMAETLARISERCSRRAREFAAAFGAADAYYAELLQDNFLA